MKRQLAIVCFVLIGFAPAAALAWDRDPAYGPSHAVCYDAWGRAYYCPSAYYGYPSYYGPSVTFIGYGHSHSFGHHDFGHGGFGHHDSGHGGFGHGGFGHGGGHGGGHAGGHSH